MARLRRVFSFLGLLIFGTALLTACGNGYDSHAAPAFLFEDHPLNRACDERYPGKPLPPGTHAWLTFSPQATYLRSRLFKLQLPLSDVPALTIAAEPMHFVHVVGEARNDWSLQLCAQGEGNTDEEARNYLQEISMVRTGALVTLSETHQNGLTGGKGDLVADAPYYAPLTAHILGAIDVRNMAGPVRISADGRATILNTTGRVDADAMIVDYAGSQGTVSLNSTWEANIKFTASRFQGSLTAIAQRQIRVLAPPGFQSPIEILVNRPKDFVCRADICSKFKKDRENSLYRFTFSGLRDPSAGHVALRSENSTVVLDMVP